MSSTKALVDGPCTGVRRQAISFNKLWLTDFTLKISPSAREKQVRRRFEEAGILAKWEKTSWARKMAMRKRRAQLTDFERFKLKVLKQQVRCCSAVHIGSRLEILLYLYLKVNPGPPLACFGKSSFLQHSESRVENFLAVQILEGR